jgi:RNA polymerase sigma factor (sigma-70 family)
MMLTEGRDVGNPPPRSSYDRHFECDLLRRLRCNDPQVVAEAMNDLCIYTFRLAAPVVRFRLGPHDADHDDVLQDIAVVMLKKIDTYEDRGTPLAHYITSVAKKVAQDYLGRRSRHDKRNHSLDDYDLDPKEQRRITRDYRNERAHPTNGPEPSLGELNQVERDRLILNAIRNLDPRDQQIIKVMYFNGITNSQEIANLLRMTAVNVRQRRSRAFEKLRNMGLGGLLDDLCLF